MPTDEGFLAIWSDIPAPAETNYLHWLTREHTAERVSVPGFLGVRVFCARSVEYRRYFILYRLERPDVVASDAYLARLNAPTEWSRRIMPILQNFIRGGGRIVAEAGQGDGAMVVPIMCETSQFKRACATLGQLVSRDRVVAARLLEVDRGGTEIGTNEKAMRTRDQTFPGLLLIEALSDAALDSALQELQRSVRTAEPLVRYDQVFALHRHELLRATR